MSPLCESFLTLEKLNQAETFYPLHVRVCDDCFLVQLEEYVPPDEIFTEYAYFSSFSDTWLRHARNYVAMMVDRLNLDERSFVVEVASNDGYLLQNFVGRKIPCTGIEPAKNVAAAAERRGVPTLTTFLGADTARQFVAAYGPANLVIGNNVLAQVPDLNDFVAGLKILLAPAGVITLEFPHLLRLMRENQFDTIYHEHFSYFSFLTTERIFAAHGLRVFDVEELPTHGGSLRVYASRDEDVSEAVGPQVLNLRAQEAAAGLDRLESYSSFARQVEETKHALLAFLIDARRSGRTIVGYGAPGKGNTLLNYCGIRTDFLDYTVDRNPYKQGMYLPGTHIPIRSPEAIKETRPDYILILPWNLKDEIIAQLAYARSWRAQFIVPIPRVTAYA